MIDLVLYRLNENAPATWRAYTLAMAEALGMDIKGSYEWVRAQVDEAVRQEFNKGQDGYAFVLATFPDSIIYGVEEQQAGGGYKTSYYQVGYSIGPSGMVEFTGQPQPVELKTVVVQKVQEALRSLTKRMLEVGRRNNKNDEKRLQQILSLVKELLGEAADPVAFFVREDMLPEVQVNPKNPKQWSLEPADMKALIKAIDAELAKRKKKKQQQQESIEEAVRVLQECPSRKGKTFQQWKGAFKKWLSKANTRALTGYRRRLVMHLAKAGIKLPKKGG